MACGPYTAPALQHALLPTVWRGGANRRAAVRCEPGATGAGHGRCVLPLQLFEVGGQILPAAGHACDVAAFLAWDSSSDESRNKLALVVGTVYSLVGTGLVILAVGCRPIVLQEEHPSEADHDVKLHEHFKDFCPSKAGWAACLIGGLAMLLSQFLVMNCTVPDRPENLAEPGPDGSGAAEPVDGAEVEAKPELEPAGRFARLSTVSRCAPQHAVHSAES